MSNIQSICNHYDLLAELCSISCELTELKKSRKIDEKKLRQKIVDEYDDLVQELANEIIVLQNRFHEYQMNNFNEVMLIMAESKEAELKKVAKNENLPVGMRDTASRMIEQEIQEVDFRNENHEVFFTCPNILASNDCT